MYIVSNTRKKERKKARKENNSHHFLYPTNFSPHVFLMWNI